MDVIYTIFFIIIAGILILSALGVILFRSIVHSAISLIVTFLSTAGIFMMLNADFVAISQIIVYGVGITIVLIFAIMLTGKESDKKLWIAFAPRTLLALAIAGGLFLLMTYTITGGYKAKSEHTRIFRITPYNAQMERSIPQRLIKYRHPEYGQRTQKAKMTAEIIKQEGTAGIIGNALLTKYVLPFEVLSILLLAAIFGAVVLARKDNENLVNPTTAQTDTELSI